MHARLRTYLVALFATSFLSFTAAAQEPDFSKVQIKVPGDSARARAS